MEDTGLKVRFTFSDDLMKKNNMERKCVYDTLKEAFSERGLVCISDGEELLFEGTGKEDDYGNIWCIIMALIKGDWITKCATSFDYINNGNIENILSQIPEAKQKLARLVASA